MKKLISLLAIAVFLVSTSTFASAYKLTWTDNSDNETAFVVYAKVGTGAYAEAGRAMANATSFPIPDPSVTEITCYKIKAINAMYESAFSNEACTIKLNAPGGLLIVP